MNSRNCYLGTRWENDGSQRQNRELSAMADNGLTGWLVKIQRKVSQEPISTVHVLLVSGQLVLISKRPVSWR